MEFMPEVCMDWILFFFNTDSLCFQREADEVFSAATGSGLHLILCLLKTRSSYWLFFDLY